MTSGAKRSSGSAAAAVRELAMGGFYAPLNVEPADPKAARFNASTLYRDARAMQA